MIDPPRIGKHYLLPERGGATAPAERTVAANCERWVALQQAKVAGGKLAPDRADNLRIYLNHFRDFLGGTAAVDGVDAPKLEGFYRWCMQKVQQRQQDKDGKAGWSAVYAKKVFDTARVFIRYLWESGLVELPRNIDSREFGFKVGAKAIETWTAEAFRTALDAATGSGKCWKRKELIDGKLVKSDNINSCYAHLKKKLKRFKKPLKWLQRMGATLHDSRSEYSRFSEMFLGHSPRGIKDRHYSAPDQNSFDEAVTWLGRELGLVSE
jgi:hypothetical protein